MIINNITVSSDTHKTTVSADVTFFGEQPSLVYFTVANRYKDFIVADASAFLAAFLMPAMRRKEDVAIVGTVCKKQWSTIPKIMRLVKKWDVGFQPVAIDVTKTEKNINTPRYVGCFFTGGVDSFHTFIKHQKEITHLLLIHGCDIPLNNKAFFLNVKKSISKVAKETGKEIVIIESNFREVIEPKLEWEWELGSALSAVSLLLRNGFKKVYIPSGMRNDQLCPYGTHPDFDPLWSTDQLTIVHDGCEFNRLEKVMNSIAKSPLALKHLRVCCFIIKGKYNCNECFKCMQTKMELFCAGVLHKAKTLDNKLEYKKVKGVYYNCDLNFHLFGEDVLAHLHAQKKDPQLAQALAFSLAKSKRKSLLRRGADMVANFDKKYNNRRLYNAIFGMNNNQDRTILFKSLARIGLIK